MELQHTIKKNNLTTTTDEAAIRYILLILSQCSSKATYSQMGLATDVLRGQEQQGGLIKTE